MVAVRQTLQKKNICGVTVQMNTIHRCNHLRLELLSSLMRDAWAPLLVVLDSQHLQDSMFATLTLV